MTAHRHEPRGRDHELCLCGCGVSLEGMRADAKYASEACKYRDHRRRQRPPTVHAVIADCERRGVEHIIGVAVRRGEQVWHLMWPCRHCHVLHMLSQTIHELGEHQQGFVTSTGRYVGRIEGADLAIRAGQISALRWPPDLYSEDMW